MKADDIVGDIIEYESGDMTQERAVGFFQKLIDSGLAWKLQGSYGRFAVTLIEAGLCHLPGKVKCVRGS